ncbi:MAG: hypothetical protein FWD75_02185 [Propionibacteriaceae bacterium]|nr:hypothetical protein [Propionibacteriaceae bacterium]
MLGSRGFVYATAVTAGGITTFHPACDCLIIPGWGSKPTVTGYDPQTYQDKWDASGHDLKAMSKGTHENDTPPRPKVDAAIRQHLLDQAVGIW